MVYGRRRSTYRRKGRRGTRTLSTRSIFNNKSARAQASQIAALRKRINRVSRRCSPEVKVVESGTINNIGLGNFGNTSVNQHYSESIPFPVPGTGDIDRIGNIIKLLPSKMQLSLQYQEVYNSLSNGFSTVKIPLASKGIALRIFAIQTKAAGMSIPSYSELLEMGSMNADPIRASMLMTSPFKTGITGKYHILYNRVINLSEDKPLFSKTLTFRPKIKTVQWTEDSYIPKGQIYWFVISSGWGMNTYDPGAGGNLIRDYNYVNFTWSIRTPFTDA